MADISQSLTLVRPSIDAQTRLALLMAFSLGAALVFTVGFAHPDLIHNAAHDFRHSISAPCH